MSEHKAQGTVISFGDNGAPVSYDVIGKVTDFTAPSRTRASIDLTNLSDTVKRFVGAIADCGEFSISYNVDYQDAGQNAIRAAGGENHDMKIVVTDEDDVSTELAFEAHVTNEGAPAGSVDEKISSSSTFKVSGDYTITTG